MLAFNPQKQTHNKMTYSEYHVSITIGDNYHLFSNVFSTDKEARKLYNIISKMKLPNIDVILYQSKSKHIHFGSSSSSSSDGSEDLSGMTVEEYGKGYLLVPTENDSRAGTKYFLDGWWMSNQDAWFFKAKYLDNLINLGAVFDEDEDYVVVEQDEDNLEDLSGMTITEHGKGYLLFPADGDSRYGTKYFLDGWWMPKYEAWFFKAEFVDLLEDLGATFENEAEAETENEAEAETEDEAEAEAEAEAETGGEDLSSMALFPFEKGLLLKPHRKDERYGMKYFLGRVWNKSLNGWFFKHEFMEHLVELGAHFIDSPVKSKTKSHQMSPKACSAVETFRGLKSKKLSWEKYGKGFLLVPSESYKHYGTKYFRGGWWMPKHNAWFFKDSARSTYIQKKENRSKSKSKASK